MAWNAGPNTYEVAAGVFHVVGPASNWTILVEAGRPALIDCGYPRDDAYVLGSLRHLGFEPSDVVGIAATHGHVDHIGLAHKFQKRYGTPVFATGDEAANVTREVVDQVAVPEVLRQSWRPRVALWLTHAMRSGATDPVGVSRVTEVVPGRPLDLPLHPVPVSVPGHTRGHTSFLLEDRDVLIAGDALMTAHPTTGTTGPSLLPDMFNYDTELAFASLDVIADYDTALLLPGHGLADDSGSKKAVDRVRRAWHARVGGR
ncbi:MBL fold metallo-hydrolase [Spelaeicoccus albus]|uniref:Glyoxylase-like metal-dependent hydrolase (Beta-lactamase superfamily II) n=1 Tax=Spelaeicoccus albus TaxID=1280376 RepID=A0A7Z0D2Y0_9MICO|nr:MBL fold metallo-hydrolase [Spelaeicoccus albus]NYI67876.1 glyoxylase-like metal-dependent hydrolase (beta-lactamase superfamily II) [Spelaeicoccus albus]